MFRVLIKLAIVALIINGAWRVGTSYWRFYQFEDAAQEIAQFGERKSEKALCGEVLEKGSSLEIPLAPAEVNVRRGSSPVFNCEAGFQRGVGPGAPSASMKIFVDARYTESLQLLPGYRYPWEFTSSVSAWARP